MKILHYTIYKQCRHNIVYTSDVHTDIIIHSTHLGTHGWRTHPFRATWRAGRDRKRQKRNHTTPASTRTVQQCEPSWSAVDRRERVREREKTRIWAYLAPARSRASSSGRNLITSYTHQCIVTLRRRYEHVMYVTCTLCTIRARLCTYVRFF